MPRNTKQCSMCLEAKALKDFYLDHGRPGSRCIACQKKYMIEYREKNKDKIDKTRKRHYKENRQLHRDRSQHYNSSLAGRFVGWRSSAKSRGIDWELTYDDVIAMPMICFYTNRQLTLEVDKLNTMSLDRIDNSKGYTKENTVPCCYYVNIMKNKFDAKQFLELCAAVAENQTKILKRL